MNVLQYQILAATVFCLGACIGSFLNVVIYRLPLNMSVNDPKRSFCPSCKNQIPFYQNIPIFSWLLLRGRCANCKGSISPRYVIVEILTGVLFLAVFLKYFPFTGQLPDGRYFAPGEAANPYLVFPYIILLSLFVAGTYIDLDHYILPDEITLGGAVAGLGFSAFIPRMHGQDIWWQNLLQSAMGAAIGFGILFLVVELGKKLFGRKRMEFPDPLAWTISQPEDKEIEFILAGDATPWSDMFYRKTDRLILECPTVQIDDTSRENAILEVHEKGVDVRDATAGSEILKLDIEHINAMSGTCRSVVIPREAMGFGDVKFMALVGAFLGWKGVLFTIFSASIIGTLFAMVLIIAGRREWATKVPFGPYLALGAAIFLFCGHEILTWYFSLGRGGEG